MRELVQRDRTIGARCRVRDQPVERVARKPEALFEQLADRRELGWRLREVRARELEHQRGGCELEGLAGLEHALRLRPSGKNFLQLFDHAFSPSTRCNHSTTCERMSFSRP